MKRKVVYYFLCASGVALPAEQMQSEHKALVTPSFYGGVIHLSDLTQSAASSSAMFTIKSSGRYYVADDLSLAPSNNTVTGVKIDANNVTLNFNETTLHLRSGNSATSTIGLEVAASRSNVHIHNGHLNGLNQSSSIAIKVGNSCARVTLRDMTVGACTQGIDFVGTSGNTIDSALLENILVTGATNVGPLRMAFCNACVVKNSVFNDSSFNNDDLETALDIVDSVACEFINCTANGHANINTGIAAAVASFVLARCQSCSFKDCVATGNTGVLVYGFYAQDVRFCVYDNCLSSYHRGTLSDPASRFRVYGMYFVKNALVAGDVTGNVIKNCTVLSCSADSDSTAGSDIVAGIYFADDLVGGRAEVGSSIIDCTVQAQNAKRTSLASCYGIYIDDACSQCEVRGNTVLFNIAASSSVGYGIYDNGTTDGDVLYADNIASGNDANYFVAGGTTAISKATGNYDDYSLLTTAKSGFYNIDIS